MGQDREIPEWVASELGVQAARHLHMQPWLVKLLARHRGSPRPAAATSSTIIEWMSRGPMVGATSLLWHLIRFPRGRPWPRF